ncbi:MAG: RDD family protein [Terriglobales bacterium]
MTVPYWGAPEYHSYARPPAWPSPGPWPSEFAPRSLVGRRWCARLIDWFLTIAITLPSWFASAHYLHGRAASVAYRFGEEGLPQLLVGGWTGLDDELAAEASQLWQTVIWVAVLTLVAQLAVAVLYDWLFHTVWGRTLGKLALGIEVRAYDRNTQQPLKRRPRPGIALLRAVLCVLLPGLAWVSILSAAVSLRPGVALLGLPLLATSVIEAASLHRQGVSQTCGHDRWTGTVVMRGDRRRQVPAGWQAMESVWQAPLTRQAAAYAADAAQQVWHAEATQRVVDHVRTAAQNIVRPPTARRGLERGVEMARRGSSFGQVGGGDSARVETVAVEPEFPPIQEH